MKKKYRMPKVVNANEKIYPAVLNGLVWFALRALMKGNTALENNRDSSKVLQFMR